MHKDFFITYIFLLLQFLTFFGWGIFLANLLHIKIENKLKLRNFILQTLNGIFTVILILNIIYLFLPIQFNISLGITILGILFLIIDYLRNKTHYKVKITTFNISLFTILVLFTSWLILRGMVAPTVYDDGLYHFNKIRWINTYHIIPGLGNIHGRLAFNQTFFTFTAYLNFFPKLNFGRVLANNIFVIIVCLAYIDMLNFSIKKYSRYKNIFYGLILITPSLIYKILTSYEIGSASPDLAIYMIEIIIFVYFVYLILRLHHERAVNSFNLFSLLLVATLLISIKLSSIIFAGFIFLLILIQVYLHSEDKKRFLTTVSLYILLPTVYLMIWIAHSYILSGAPLFPSTLGYINFPWAVPKNKIQWEADLIYAWARYPHHNYKEVLSNYNWIKEYWISYIQRKDIIQDFTYPTIIASISTLFAFLKMLKEKILRKNLLPFTIILLPVIAEYLYWFFTAPDVRFLGSMPLLFVFISFIFVLESINITKWHYSKLYLFNLVIFLSINIYVLTNLGTILLSPKLLPKLTTQGVQDLPSVDLEQKKTKYGVTIYIPSVQNKNKEQVWDNNKLPSTPRNRYNDNLEYIQNNNIQKGFKIHR